MLAKELTLALSRKTLTLFQVKEFVLTETPAYKYKSTLKALEKDELIQVINAPPKRRKWTFPDNYVDKMQIQFPPRLF